MAAIVMIMSVNNNSNCNLNNTDKNSDISYVSYVNNNKINQIICLKKCFFKVF